MVPYDTGYVKNKIFDCRNTLCGLQKTVKAVSAQSRFFAGNRQNYSIAKRRASQKNPYFTTGTQMEIELDFIKIATLHKTLCRTLLYSRCRFGK